MGTYPVLETPNGGISGALAICKHLCRQSGKLSFEADAFKQAEVDQWTNWVLSTLAPTAAQVMQGIYGGNAQGIQVQ